MMRRHVYIALSAVLVLAAAPVASAGSSVPTTSFDLANLQPAGLNPPPGAENVMLVRLAGPTTGELLRAGGWDTGWSAGPDGASVPTAAHEARVDAAVATVAAFQATARAYIESTGAEILSTYDAALNGFLVFAQGAELAALQRTPRLASVRQAPYFVPLLEDAVPQMGAIEVAQNLGFTGKNVTIAIVDTGVDYTHENLGGSGKVQDYDKARLNPARAEGLFPNNKVVGGYDLAGTNYQGAANSAVPDEDPLDENSHGSHVAGIAGGAAGNNKLHHGVAKDASIIALKVFGRGGGTNIAQDAVEWAIEVNERGRPPEGQGVCRLSPCHIDVMNLSLGAPFGLLLEGYGDVFKNATAAGIVVVASAGNDGDVAWITGAPAVDPNVLSVASAWARGETGDQVKVSYDPGTGQLEETLEAVEAEPALAPQISASPDISARLGWFGRGCDGDRQEGEVTGRIALIQRGGCGFQQKLNGAARAGATAALVFSNGTEITPMGSEGGMTTIVGFMIDTASGERLRTLITEGVQVQATFSKSWKNTFARDYLADVVSGFSSRGPGRNGALKPNITGLGSQINSVKMGSGDQGMKLSGTSMSGPTVAGAAAVLVESLRARGMAPAGPLTGVEGLSALDVGTLLVNGAQSAVWKDDSRLGVPVAVARGGAGRADLSVSTRLETVVRAGTRRPDSPGTPFGIDFDFPQFDDVFTDDRPFFVRNASTEARSYAVAVEFRDPADRASGVTFTTSESSMTLQAGETMDLTLDLRADPSQMKPYPAYGGEKANVSAGLTAAEHDAFVVVTEVDGDGNPVAGGDVSRLPVYVLPRAASVLGFDPDPLIVASTGETTLDQATNAGGPEGVIDLFVPAGRDNPDVNLDPLIDIDYVGARVITDDADDRVIEILVHNKGPRVAPMDTIIRVGIDTDRNGSVDYLAIAQDVALWPYPWCQNPLASYSGVIGVSLTRVAAQSPLSFECAGAIRYMAGVDIFSSATILPILAADLGYQAGTSIAFDIVVLHEPLLPGVITAGRSTFDAAPNDGFVPSGNSLGIGPGRMHFSEDGAGVAPAQWRVDVPGQGTADVPLARIPNSTIGPLLAYYRTNLPGNDIALVPVEEGVIFTNTVYLPALKRPSR